ncbi:succinate dehydrogenase assembly factor 4, mitochondrial-like [Ostrinia nubilalis]|uniref:succinate dehydrogenase assembly factor 4, mitochondrial-like n=1 Tax=Ostrinia furnacalis TaxID=93504 RepID=UPI001038AB0D|nr:succinate dehydrogenase assembly factor 4, mitochondrial-like [Ostrinia furnacalis]
MLLISRLMHITTRKQLCKAHTSSLVMFQYAQKSNIGMDDNPKPGESKRMAEFRKKLRETTPIDDLGDQPLNHPEVKDDPLPAWPDNTNPHTGEVGGPRGPEPTRYGDWERKGRVTDF